MEKFFVTVIRRNLETIAVLAYVLLMMYGGISGLCFMAWGVLFSPTFRIPCLFYLAWQYYDTKTIENGRRISNWLRKCIWWRYVLNYFPVKLIKTAELSPDESYLFVTCPHGVFSTGTFAAFGADLSGFQDLFPGITPRMATAKFIVACPLSREISLSMGGILASEKSLLKFLGEKGNGVGLIPGGAEEAFHLKRGSYHTVLGRRKGFIRVALKTGASLVPTISFGETEIFDQIHIPRKSVFGRFQDAVKNVTGIAPIQHYGRGFFGFPYGLVPFRKPINVVFGAPIKLPKIEEPDSQQIDEAHKLFCEKLQDLFNTEKFKYVDNPSETQLEFV